MYLQKNLKYLLSKNKLSYRDVSRESGVSTRAISFIVNNDCLNVTLYTIIKLSSYFNISIDKLINEDLSKENVPPDGTLREE